MKYRTITRFQQEFVVTEYWGLFIIRDRINGAKGVIGNHVILIGNIPYG